MNLLVNTHVFLSWDQGGETFSKPVRDAIARRRGKLDFPDSPSAAIGANGFQAWPILPEDAEWAGDLVWDDGDPFWRRGATLGRVGSGDRESHRRDCSLDRLFLLKKFKNLLLAGR
jgi:PIN domain nuclease of toxin-antitoxin system